MLTRQPIGKHRRYGKQLGMERTVLRDALHICEGEFLNGWYKFNPLPFIIIL